MKERHSAHQTQWAAQFAVASELCKRGYEVALTLGNHPAVDLMVISPKRKSFHIDVKGLYRKNPWAVRPRPLQDDLYYVFAFVPEKEANRFYILSQEKVNDEVRRHIEVGRKRAIEKGKSPETAEKFPVLLWEFVQSWENKWEEVLPA